MATYAVNPANNYREKATTAFTWLWCLLFGPFFFAYKGVWAHVFFWFLATIFTGGLGWLIYPFFASGVVHRFYAHKGWIMITSQEISTKAKEDKRKVREEKRVITEQQQQAEAQRVLASHEISGWMEPPEGYRMHSEYKTVSIHTNGREFWVQGGVAGSIGSARAYASSIASGVNTPKNQAEV